MLAPTKLRALRAVPQGGVVATFPVPVVTDGRLLAHLCWYLRWHDGRHKRLGGELAPPLNYPPNKLYVIDPFLGVVLEERDVTPVDFGMSMPAREPLPPSGRSIAASMDELLARHARVDELAPLVWPLFARHAASLDDAAVRWVEAYLAAFEGSHPEEIRPFLRVLGKDFYAWARQCHAKVPT